MYSTQVTEMSISESLKSQSSLSVNLIGAGAVLWCGDGGTVSARRVALSTHKGPHSPPPHTSQVTARKGLTLGFVESSFASNLTIISARATCASNSVSGACMVRVSGRHRSPLQPTRPQPRDVPCHRKISISESTTR